MPAMLPEIFSWFKESIYGRLSKNKGNEHFLYLNIQKPRQYFSFNEHGSKNLFTYININSIKYYLLKVFIRNDFFSF